MTIDPELDFIQTLRKYLPPYSVTTGDERLSQKFSASRAVLSYDSQASEQDKKDWLAAPGMIEAELLSASFVERALKWSRIPNDRTVGTTSDGRMGATLTNAAESNVLSLLRHTVDTAEDPSSSRSSRAGTEV